MEIANLTNPESLEKFVAEVADPDQALYSLVAFENRNKERTKRTDLAIQMSVHLVARIEKNGPAVEQLRSAQGAVNVYDVTELLRHEEMLTCLRRRMRGPAYEGPAEGYYKALEDEVRALARLCEFVAQWSPEAADDVVSACKIDNRAVWGLGEKEEEGVPASKRARNH